MSYAELSEYDTETFNEERSAIDRAFANGVTDEDVQAILEHHVEGVPFYAKDAVRYDAPFLGDVANDD